jgi:hypothetical protein
MWNEFSKLNTELTTEGMEYLTNIKHYGYAEKNDNDNEVIKELTDKLLVKYNIK